MNQQPKDRIAVQVGDALRRADAGAFDQELEGKRGLVHRHRHGAEGLLVRFGVGLLADRAAEATKAVAMLAKTAAFCVAVRASHCSGLFFVTDHDSIIQQAVAVVKWVQ